MGGNDDNNRTYFVRFKSKNEFIYVKCSEQSLVHSKSSNSVNTNQVYASIGERTEAQRNNASNEMMDEKAVHQLQHTL